jgi:DNA repair protein RadC
MSISLDQVWWYARIFLSYLTPEGWMEIKVKQSLQKLTKPDSVSELFSTLLAREHEVDQGKEHFWVAGLTTKNDVAYVELVSLGILNASLVHPRETFRFAIMKGVSSLILCHNHPSGEETPSDDDIALTRRLADAGRILGIEVLDHVIVTKRSHFSFKEQGFL